MAAKPSPIGHDGRAHGAPLRDVMIGRAQGAPLQALDDLRRTIRRTVDPHQVRILRAVVVIGRCLAGQSSRSDGMRWNSTLSFSAEQSLLTLMRASAFE